MQSSEFGSDTVGDERFGTSGFGSALSGINAIASQMPDNASIQNKRTNQVNDESIENYLTSHEFFSGLDDAYIRFLAENSVGRRLGAGDVLFKQGNRADRFYLLKSGEIAIQVPALTGPALEIQALGAGQILGWSWLIAPYRWHFLARALGDSEVIEFDGTAILEHCDQDPRFGYEVLKRFAALMSERLDAARLKMMEQWNPPGFA